MRALDQLCKINSRGIINMLRHVLLQNNEKLSNKNNRKKKYRHVIINKKYSVLFFHARARACCVFL